MASNVRGLVLSDFEPYLSSLKPLPIWVGWRKVPDKDRPGKFRKPPYSARDGSHIGATSSWPPATESEAWKEWVANHPGETYQDHWLPFAEAWPGVIQHGLEGPGLVIRKEDGLIGVDFDDCVRDGVISPIVMPWITKWSQPPSRRRPRISGDEDQRPQNTRRIRPLQHR